MLNYHDDFTANQIEHIAKFLKSSGVLAYPSESVWGLGCDAFDKKAVEQILSLKKRSVQKGLIVLTDDIKKIMPLLSDLSHQQQQTLINQISAQQTHLQATTWLLPVAKSASIPKFLTGDFTTLAVRITLHPILKKICHAITDDQNPYGFLVSTSCNLQGQAPACNLYQAKQYFSGDKFLDNKVNYPIAFLDAQSLGFDKPSQIIDGMTGKQIR